MDLLNDEQKKDLLTDAFHGGSNYWYQIEDTHLGKYNSLIDKAFGPGITVSNKTFQEREPNADIDRSELLTVEIMEYGAQVMKDSQPKHFANIISDNHDSETADVYLQCCLFGKIIYG